MSQPLRALMIEDSDSDAELLLMQLRRADYEPIYERVQTEAEMRRALAEKEWDIILCDYSLPTFDAPSAIAVNRETRPRLPIIIVSGTIGEDVAVETLKQGADDYLLKQNLTRLRPAIERALENSAHRRQRLVAEATLRRDAQIFAQLGEAVICADLSGHITYWNEYATKLHGWTSEVMLGKPVTSLFPPSQVGEVETRINDALKTGRFYGEVESLRKEGPPVWIELHITPLVDDAGNTIGFIGLGRDISIRRKRDETLRLRERALTEVSQGVLICDENRLITYANAAFTAITGYTRAELLGRSCSILQGAETDPAIVQKIRDALNAAQPFEGEILNFRKDGAKFWNELTITPIPGHDGQSLNFVGIQRDVTARKEADDFLRKSEERFRHERALLRALLDCIPDLIFFKSRDSVFLGCNKSFEDKMNIREQDLIGKTDFDLVPPETAEFYQSRDRELLLSGKAQRTEEWIPFRNGKRGYFETLKTPYYGPSGESLGLIGVSRDITERKLAEEKLLATAERMRLAAEAAGAGIWELDLNTNLATWDNQMFALFGRKNDSAPGGIERWFRSMHPDDIDKCYAVLDETTKRGLDAFEVEFRIFRDDDGSQRLIQSAGIVKRNAEGKAIRMVGLNRDVTEERVRETELAQALAQEKELTRKARAGERAKSEFLAMMSHEIRTPMNGILGFAEILSQTPNLPSSCRDSVQTITSSAEALLRILDDILDFSRLEAGQLEIEKTPFSPRALLNDLQTILAPAAQEKGLRLNFEEGPDIPSQLVGDPGRLRQILLNLVGNAIKFTSAGSVSVSMRHLPRQLWSDSHYFAFSVRDTGPGIPEEKLEAIFQPFVQADASISRRHGGTGLGLTISRRLVQLLDGTLTAKSEPGKGAEFLLTLPFELPRAPVDDAPAPEEAHDASFAQKHPLSVLLVEDDKVNLKLIGALTRRLGYEPLLARNGCEAVKIFRESRPDCIFMDLQMPEMDGIEATEAIRQLEAETKSPPAFIVALTANILPADRQRCMNAGMNDYLNKPVKPDALAMALTHASEQAAGKS